MDDPDRLEVILQFINRQYGSLSEPDFDFFQRAREERPYKRLVSHLAEKYSVKEVTEPNIDVSFGYVLESQNGRWYLQLSAVGPFAVLTRTTEKAPPLTHESDLCPDEKAILEILEDFDLTPLGQELLEHPIKLKLFETEPGDVVIYNALFTDWEILPWQAKNYV